ncbi:MAG: hypothetical protein RJQ09_18760 [Cyclobacteriaceae bacterium]
MKKYLNFLTYSLFAALVVFASCGGGDDDDDDDVVEPTPLEQVVASLTNNGAGATWASSSSSLDGVAAEGWENFQITINGNASGGTYSTSGAADATVWPASGTWTFSNTTGTKAIRQPDGIELDITASDNALTLSFDIPEGRTNGIAGRWSQTFTR